MFETNVNEFSEEKNIVYTQKDKLKKMISNIKFKITQYEYLFQSKAVKFHAEKLKEKLNYAMREGNDEKLDQKE